MACDPDDLSPNPLFVWLKLTCEAAPYGDLFRLLHCTLPFESWPWQAMRRAYASWLTASGSPRDALEAGSCGIVGSGVVYGNVLIPRANERYTATTSCMLTGGICHGLGCSISLINSLHPFTSASGDPGLSLSQKAMALESIKETIGAWEVVLVARFRDVTRPDASSLRAYPGRVMRV
ncbi:hypothetical protein CCM_04099 [Cordyceps militaris CM01]|uniref:Uncharacterized protein n=1 Tax=Cordyceps militaris (strain CM01) TaxID=983644 RepID=G3JDQ1_CORMM|nr:uncharacterized protein CCM_04099 [Cordyceps militaris CM01]EGX92726.1 hypothetical protein CCM_04099 [Cordyceps militaris CM01]